LISSTITDWKEESGGDKEVDEDDFTGNDGSVGDGGNNEPGSGGDDVDDDEDDDDDVDDGEEEIEDDVDTTTFGYGVYTSNPDIWSYDNNGTNSSDNALYININDTQYRGVKLASTDRLGVVTSTSISKENSKMSFYAKGHQSTLTVSVTGAKLKDDDDGTSTSKTIKLEDSPITGSGNTISTTAVTNDDHYVFDLVDVTEDFKVTFRAEKGNVCFVWGVNYK
jgi:hypothetical protein